MMIFKQGAAASILLSSLLILGAPDAAFGRLRGDIKGGDRPRRGLERIREDTPNARITSGNSAPDAVSITSGMVTGVTRETSKADFGESISQKETLVFTNVMTSKNLDPSVARVYGVGNTDFDLSVQSENPNETNARNEEDVGFVAFSISDDRALLRDAADRVIGEVGRFPDTRSRTITWNDESISSFFKYIAIITPISNMEGDEPVHVRVTNVKVTTGQVTVDYEVDEKNETALQIAYTILVHGCHIALGAGGDDIIEAKLENDIDQYFRQIDFGREYDDTPVVLGQSQTNRGAASTVIRMKEATSEGIKIRVQEEEGKDGSTEDVGIVVIHRRNK